MTGRLGGKRRPYDSQATLRAPVLQSLRVLRSLAQNRMATEEVRDLRVCARFILRSLAAQNAAKKLHLRGPAPPGVLPACVSGSPSVAGCHHDWSRHGGMTTVTPAHGL